MTLWSLLQVLLFGYPPAPEMIDSRFPEFLQRVGGLSLTLTLTALSLLFGVALGCLLALCRRESFGNASASGNAPAARLALRGLNLAAAALVETVRGLPVMILALLVFYLPYPLTGLRFPGVILAVAAFSLYAAAYFSELVRAGFRSVPPGLREAGRVLGIPSVRIFLKVELPLVTRNMMPDIVNLAVTVFKDTSVLAVAAVAELTFTARQAFMSQPMDYSLVLLLTMFLYWAPAALVSSFLTARGDGRTAFRFSR
ncbi:MAG: ABC transporter permease subunit [Acidobacteriota bacterium]|jgi:His/Glu/Gln/Arg/opine family amino acid ABC transporter permease subunit|nr:ABC transporter permease subunit [Acidobacteriota bacterium]